MAVPVQNLIGIDGRYFNIFIPTEGIKRKFNVADTDEAGRVLTGRMFRDIIGTFYNYNVTIATNYLEPEEYDELYEILSAPEESHIFTLPYGQTVISFEAYVTTGEDTLTVVRNGVNKWSGLAINIIAMEPLRY